MKVYIKFPWKFVDSPYYKSLVNYPPKGIYFSGIKKTKVITSPKIFGLQNAIKRILRISLEVFKIPNIAYTFSKEDLIHCAHCLLLNKKLWVVDVETYWNFSASSKISHSKTGKHIIKKLLKREFCKKIMPWTYAAKNTIEKAIKDKEISNKIEVVYPAIPIRNTKRKKHKTVSLLFIGRYFYQKGGLFALEAFKRLKQKYDVDCTLISLTIPNRLKNKYKNFVKIYNSVSEEVLFNKIYPMSSIFVYPGFSDTFGFSLLEAMSFGIPIVTVDAFARREIVENNKNGFVIKRPKNLNVYKIGKVEETLVEKIVEKTSLLIEDSSLRKRMGKYGRRLVEKGKFSIKERNKKLKKIYEEALRC